jgi:hypothetical protein
MFFRLLPRAPTTRMQRGPSASAGALRHLDPPPAGQIIAGQRFRIGGDLGGRALGDDVAAVDAGRRAHVDQVVGGADRVLIVLHHQHGVAEVAQPPQRAQQPLVVALVQADRGFIQHIQHAGQPEPIWLARRMRWLSPPDSVAEPRDSVR